MSLILKGIDKKDILKNEKCIFQTYDWNCGKVCFLGLIMECSTALPCEPNKKAEKCPIIQIPKDHGRLIDGDALELEKEVELADDWKTAHEIANCVKYAPTILAEE